MTRGWRRRGSRFPLGISEVGGAQVARRWERGPQLPFNGAGWGGDTSGLEHNPATNHLPREGAARQPQSKSVRPPPTKSPALRGLGVLPPGAFGGNAAPKGCAPKTLWTLFLAYLHNRAHRGTPKHSLLGEPTQNIPRMVPRPLCTNLA